jgi:hypothetical protein
LILYLFVLFVIILIIFVVVILVVSLILFLPLHSTFSKSFHHFEKLLAVIFEKIVCNGQNTS